MKKRFASLVVALFFGAMLCTLSLSQAARNGGGNSIATAPQLPIGQNVVDGATCASGGGVNGGMCPKGIDDGPNVYWKILAQAADHLTIDISSTGESGVLIYILSPSINDYNIGLHPDYLLYEGANPKKEVTYTFPSAGTYTLLLTGYETTQIGYELTAYIRHFTHTTITAPPAVKSRTPVTLRGVVAGASGGNIELQSRSAARPVWKTFALAQIGATGAFSYKTKVAGAGTYRIKAVYPGDSAHLPSSSIVSFKVF